MTARPNRNGRAFEFIVLEDLIKELKKREINYSITERGIKYHNQDKIFFNELSDGNSKDINLRNDYLKNVNLITNWIFKKFDLESYDSLILDKLPDNAGKDGDITDIRIILIKNKKQKDINLSLKNNSNALKHSRISGIPKWLGISEDSKEFTKYLDEYNFIWENIANKIEHYNTNNNNKVIIYNQLDLISKNFKNNEIYSRYYNLIENFFNNFCSTPKRTNKLFRYLIGTVDFYKIINKSKFVLIDEYLNIKSPTKVTFSRNTKGYLLLIFDNDFKISIRLHNGDDKLSPSLKVDAQFDKKSFKVPEIKLKK